MSSILDQDGKGKEEKMQQGYPILEFDSAPEAVLEPRRLLKPMDVSEHAVACFFQDVITTLSQQHNAKVVKHLRSEIGSHPIYEIEIEGKRLIVFHPGVGAPLAAALLEEVIALGCRKFIACSPFLSHSLLQLAQAFSPIAAKRCFVLSEGGVQGCCKIGNRLSLAEMQRAASSLPGAGCPVKTSFSLFACRHRRRE